MEMAVAEEHDEDGSPDEVDHSINGGKKDPLIRRRELLVNSGLAEVFSFPTSINDISLVSFHFLVL